MFPARYFPGRYFNARYWVKVGADQQAPEVPGIELRLSSERTHYKMNAERLHYRAGEP